MKSQTSKPMKHHKRLIAAYLLIPALWMLTFIVAYSECTVQEFVEARCFTLTRTSSGVSDAVSQRPESDRLNGIVTKSKAEEVAERKAADASEKKGQFGDFFGVLNALFGALTLVIVYSNLVEERHHAKREREAAKAFHDASMKAQRDALDEARSSAQSSKAIQLRTNYYADINVAIQTYHRILGEVLVPVKDKEGALKSTWPARHGLFHLWHHFMVYKLRNAHVTRSPAGTCDAIWNDPFTLPKYMADDSEGYQRLTNLTRDHWVTLYHENKYQLDALFRSWEFVYRTISRDKVNKQIDDATHEFAAASWYAQLSQIELQFVVAHATFGENKAFNHVFSQVAQDPSFPELAGLSDIAIKVLVELRTIKTDHST
jgi:hypothetical protein